MSRSPKDIRLVVISGLSGSGKSCVIKCFEDLGFFCVDNLPPQLLPQFAELCRASDNHISRAAIGIDIRERTFLLDFLNIYDELIQAGYGMELLFLEARDEILQRRFSESRRPHPLAKEGRVSEGIERERETLGHLRGRADRVVDTSDWHVHELKEIITQFYLEKGRDRRLNVSLISFGYKFGVPYELDLLFDVRFLKNPHFVDALRPLTGNDAPVRDYVLKLPETSTFLLKLYDLLAFLIPLYQKEGKSYLTIGIGCTGGRHRSVALTNQVNAHLNEKGMTAHCRHRDVAAAGKSCS